MFCGRCGTANPDDHAYCRSCGHQLPAVTPIDPLDARATVLGFLPGQRLANRYELERLLGRGGMGQVWLARDAELDLAVAVKVVNDHLWLSGCEMLSTSSVVTRRVDEGW